MTCLWCDHPFAPNPRGNQEKQFCSTKCREMFWSAARRWVAMAVRVGLVSVADLKRAGNAVHGKPEAIQHHDGGAA